MMAASLLVLAVWRHMQPRPPPKSAPAPSVHDMLPFVDIDEGGERECKASSQEAEILTEQLSRNRVFWGDAGQVAPRTRAHGYATV